MNQPQYEYRLKSLAPAVVVVSSFFLLGTAQLTPRHPPIPETDDREVDFSACSVCHSDKTQGNVVHAAVALGCEGCHGVDQDEDWTEVYLLTRGNTLCLTCHGDKQAEPTQLALHPPVRNRTCITCHDPHTSEAAYLLHQRAEGRRAEENLCLSCHTDIADQVQKPVEHLAVDLGCAGCHITHKSDPQGTPEGMLHLTQAEPALCLTCHDVEEEPTQAAHSNQPVLTSRCSLCHNPHGSENPKLINNVIHAAFEMGCETCHAQPSGGKVSLQEGAGREMCLLCHMNVEEQIAEAQLVHFPLEMPSGCVACHNPHATTNPRLIRQQPVRVCLDCHTALAEAQTDKEHLHRPVFEQGCVVCHQPHAAERDRLLRVEVNDLCLECHSQGIARAVAVRKRGNVPLKLFGEKVEMKPTALENVPTIWLTQDKERGHPYHPRHPVTGEDTLGRPMSCLSCHRPHAANGNKKLFVSESPVEQELCVKCH